MNFTIIQINNNSIDVSFDVDNISQNLSGAPVGDVNALNQWLYDYGMNYENGLVQAGTPVVAPEVTALVGQSMSLEQVDVKGVKTLQSSISATPIGVKGVKISA